jgi:hypothetical protein
MIIKGGDMSIIEKPYNNKSLKLNSKMQLFYDALVRPLFFKFKDYKFRQLEIISAPLWLN